MSTIIIASVALLAVSTVAAFIIVKRAPMKGQPHTQAHEGSSAVREDTGGPVTAVHPIVDSGAGRGTTTIHPRL